MGRLAKSQNQKGHGWKQNRRA